MKYWLIINEDDQPLYDPKTHQVMLFVHYECAVDHLHSHRVPDGIQGKGRAIVRRELVDEREYGGLGIMDDPYYV